MCVRKYIYMYGHIYIYIYQYMNAHLHRMHICIYISMYECMYLITKQYLFYFITLDWSPYYETSFNIYYTRLVFLL